MDFDNFDLWGGIGGFCLIFGWAIHPVVSFIGFLLLMAAFASLD